VHGRLIGRRSPQKLETNIIGGMVTFFQMLHRRSPEKMETNIGGLVTFFQMLCMKAEAHQRRPKEDGAALQGKQFLSLTLSL
jgi:hypothetical protein